MLICRHELGASPVSEEHHRAIDRALILWATYNRHSALLHVVAASMELIEKYHPALFNCVLEENNVNLLNRMLKTKSTGPEVYSLCCRAAHFGHLEIIKALSKASIDFNAYGSLLGSANHLPLTEASLASHIKVIDYLLQKGANPNLHTDYFQGALEAAATSGGLKGLQACKLLIDARANVRNTDALLRSYARGNREIMKLLLNAGADVNALYPALPWTLLYVGIWINYRLLLLGANINKQQDGASLYEDKTALLEAFFAIKPDVDIIELLIGAGAEINIGSLEDSGYRLLLEAIRSCDYNLVRILIQEGANPSGRPSLYTTSTPLALAAKEGSFEIMYYLLRNGARVVGFKRIAVRIPAHLANGKDYKGILTKLKQADRL